MQRHRVRTTHEASRYCRALALAAALPLLTAAGRAGAQGPAEITGRVIDAATRAPLRGVAIAVAGTSLGAITRSDGSYRMAVSPGSYVVSARFLGYTPAGQTANVEGGGSIRADFALERSVVGLGEVVVTGTRRPDRTVVDAPAPIDVLTSEEIEQSGRVEVNQIIQMLAPSFNFPRATISDGTDHVRPSTLRGLQPDQVLVLVNGKRRHNSALVNVNNSIGRGSTGVDLNAIPAAAVDRIEILRDGAAAQYGSDAIAGVINIILKSTSGSELSSTLGTTKEGDGDVIQLAGSRSWMLPGSGYLNVTAEFRDREQTNRSLPDTRQQYFSGDPRNSDPALTNQINHRQGDGAALDAGGFANFAYTFGSGVELYSFGGVTFRRGEAAGFWRRSLDDRTVRVRLYPDGFLPLIESHIWDASLTAGVRGALAGWDWDLSGVGGRNSFRFDVNNSANVTLGADSPTSFYAGTLIFDQETLNLDVRRPIEAGLASPLNIAVGAEVRRDHYAIEEGELDSYRDGGVKILDGPNAGQQPQVGAQVFPGFKPSDAQDADRTTVAAYVDLEANLTRMLLVGVAGRTEHYSDFGGTTNGKVSARFEPVSGFALRGTASTGFRAPSLAQSYFSSTATNFLVVGGVTTPFDIRTLPVGSEIAQILGAEALEPEKSRNYGIGVAIQPVPRLSLTVDFYQIEIDDRIVFSGNFVGDDIQQLLASRGFSGVRGGRFFTNAIDTRTQGVDVVLQTGFSLGGAGTLRFTGGYNANSTDVLRVAPTPPQLGNRQEVLFDRVERARIEEGQPKNNLRLAVNHTVGALAMNLATARYGAVTARSLSPDGSADQTFDAQWLTDVGLTYRLRNRHSVTLGADNVFGQYPERNIPVLSNAGIFPYNQVSPFGFNGAFYYVRLVYGM
ncbi:MAG: TonB-dependent receptor [Gemmatimonadaceae bacterium]